MVTGDWETETPGLRPLIDLVRTGGISAEVYRHFAGTAFSKRAGPDLHPPRAHFFVMGRTCHPPVHDAGLAVWSPAGESAIMDS